MNGPSGHTVGRVLTFFFFPTGSPPVSFHCVRILNGICIDLQLERPAEISSEQGHMKNNGHMVNEGNCQVDKFLNTR